MAIPKEALTLASLTDHLRLVYRTGMNIRKKLKLEPPSADIDRPHPHYGVLRNEGAAPFLQWRFDRLMMFTPAGEWCLGSVRDVGETGAGWCQVDETFHLRDESEGHRLTEKDEHGVTRNMPPPPGHGPLFRVRRACDGIWFLPDDKAGCGSEALRGILLKGEYTVVSASERTREAWNGMVRQEGDMDALISAEERQVEAVRERMLHNLLHGPKARPLATAQAHSAAPSPVMGGFSKPQMMGGWERDDGR